MKWIDGGKLEIVMSPLDTLIFAILIGDRHQGKTTTIRGISRRLGVAPNAVYQPLKRLERNGFIRNENNGKITAGTRMPNFRIEFFKDSPTGREIVERIEGKNVTHIKYVEGDATEPQGEGLKIIAHICNDIGLWGAGFVLAISKHWKLPEEAYRSLKERILGSTQFVVVSEKITIANMIAQRGVRQKGNPFPLRLESLRECLEKVCKEAKASSSSVHMPRIGCGLAGGRWSEIEPIVKSCLTDQGVEVTIYDF